MPMPRRKSASERGYNWRWVNYRRQFLREHPLCVYCGRLGKVTAATVVDHIVPHRGDDGLFWDVSNHQALCKSCHDSVKQSEERSGRIKGCDVSGVPVDPGHHWAGRGRGE